MIAPDMNWRLSIYTALVVYIGLRLPGSYYIVFGVTLLALTVKRRVLPRYVDQQLIFLAIYCLMLVFEAILSLEGGVFGALLAKRGQILLPINVFMLFACGKIFSLGNLYSSVSLLALSLSAAYSSAAAAILASNSPASQLRPLENVYVIGCLCLAFWLAYTGKSTNTTMVKRPLRLVTVVVFFSVPLVAALPVFRGILSIFAYAVLLCAVFDRLWTLFVCNQNMKARVPMLDIDWRIKGFASILVFVAILAFVGKGSVFRYTLYQFISPNPLNGRA